MLPEDEGWYQTMARIISYKHVFPRRSLALLGKGIIKNINVSKETTCLISWDLWQSACEYIHWVCVYLHMLSIFFKQKLLLLDYLKEPSGYRKLGLSYKNTYNQGQSILFISHLFIMNYRRRKIAFYVYLVYPCKMHTYT